MSTALVIQLGKKEYIVWIIIFMKTSHCIEELFNQNFRIFHDFSISNIIINFVNI